MRTPRRDFVVEYKTNRRQTKAAPISIWGSLDLQAVARAVEADGTMPEIDLPQALSALEDVAAVEPGAGTPVTQVDADGPSESSTVTSSRSESPIEPAGIGDDVFDDLPSSLDQPPLSPTPKSRARTRARTLRFDAPETLDELPDTSGHPGSQEELAALEAENRYLKRLMVSKLREENERLKFMLRRAMGA
ncbi:hypothetical protein [Rhizobium leguminosarum]|uniref:hypothetical protein n=1 Tax=Rhizobium leguminosarum TaxID=384 RepID=UPI001AE2486D|nr:hypothetical protein [Rhizobium leguminosarum]MBP2449804.1 hypothetical protein [Rhizobium leguminosarum]